MRRTPPLSLEGSREVFEEMARPPEDTPERRETLERARAEVLEGEQGSQEPPCPVRHHDLTWLGQLLEAGG